MLNSLLLNLLPSQASEFHPLFRDVTSLHQHIGGLNTTPITRANWRHCCGHAERMFDTFRPGILDLPVCLQTIDGAAYRGAVQPTCWALLASSGVVRKYSPVEVLESADLSRRRP